MWTRLGRWMHATGRRTAAPDRADRGVRRFVRVVSARPADLDPLRDDDRPDAAFERAWRGTVKARAILVLTLLGCWATGVEARLVWLQVIDHDELAARADHQQRHTIASVGTRGDILDRHGARFAYSVEADAIVADPTAIVDPPGTAAALCRALADCDAGEEDGLASSLTVKKDTKKDFVYIRRAQRVTPEQTARVADLKLSGVRVIADTRRFYPNFELGAHLLGFVGVDNTGLGGIEQSYDEVIRGREGKTVLLTDAHEKTLQTIEQAAPTAGATVELTVDLYLQYIAERELRAGVASARAAGGTAIVMDPNTGEILALANEPTFNPNAYARFSDLERTNRAVQDVYEPGSTFKMVTASAALQEGVWSLADYIDTSPGYFYLGKRRIEDSEGHDYGVLPFEDVIVKSSNVGAVRIGLKVGAEKMERYMRRFGFGEALSPDFRGQSAGIVRALPAVTDSALASMSMGYEVSVTPLQMAAAVSAVANGGTLYEPHAVRAVIRDGQREPVAPKPLRAAVSSETAAEVTSIMEDVTRRGTGTKAQLAGYQVAGKTGTAYKAIPGGYSKTDYNASFVGFVPSRRPALTIVVVIDTPRGASYFGGDVAAPIFKRIAEASLRQLGVAPTLNPTPPIVLTAAPLAAPPGPVAMMRPAAFRPIVGSSRMPDVRGLAVREAIRVLGAVGLVVRPSGSGVVLSQMPQPGDTIDPGDPATLQLGRPSIDTRAPGKGVR